VEILENRTLLNSGDIDPGFGSFLTEFQGTLGASISAAALQSDGKLVVAGMGLPGGGFQGGSSNHLLLARYNANGSLDAGFGTGGKIVTEFTVAEAFPHTRRPIPGIAIQADGKIVVMGASPGGTSPSNISIAPKNFVVLRYTSAGALDPTFGNNGKVTTDLQAPDQASALPGGVLVQSDGRIVIAGGLTSPTTSSLVLIRYQGDGTLDPAFGSGGRVNSMHGSSPVGMVLQTDGKILVENAAELVRFNSDGNLDATFGTNGVVTLSVGIGHPGPDLNGVTLQASGKILVLGTSRFPDLRGAPFVERLNVDGSPDATFGDHGIVNVLGSGQSDAFALGPDGKILVAASSILSMSSTLGRFNTDGSVDSTFGSNGQVDFSGQHVTTRALTVQADGQVLVLGSVQSNFAALRFTAAGNVDASYGTAGVVTTNFVGTVDTGASAVAVQPDGKLIAAGSTWIGFALARYNADGSPDTTFGTSGRVTTDLQAPMFSVGPVRSLRVGISLLADGRIVLGGNGYLARYSPSGNLDASLARVAKSSWPPTSCAACAPSRTARFLSYRQPK
jgi:uncharacterized delta-60 repeat protein